MSWTHYAVPSAYQAGALYSNRVVAADANGALWILAFSSHSNYSLMGVTGLPATFQGWPVATGHAMDMLLRWLLPGSADPDAGWAPQLDEAAGAGLLPGRSGQRGRDKASDRQPAGHYRCDCASSWRRTRGQQRAERAGQSFPGLWRRRNNGLVQRRWRRSRPAPGRGGSRGGAAPPPRLGCAAH